MTNSSEVTSEGPTDQHDDSAKIQTPGPGRGFAWAVAAFVVVLAIGGLYFAFSGDDGQVVDQTTVPTPTTVPSPEPETMTDLETFEAGVAALYSGDAERAVQLFELQVPDDDIWIRSEAAYQAAIGGRLTLDCTEMGERLAERYIIDRWGLEATAGAFACIAWYRNVFTDAIGWVDSPGETVHVAVEDGAVVRFGPDCVSMCSSDGQQVNASSPEHPFGQPMSGFPGPYFIIDEGLAAYLRESGYDNPECAYRWDDSNRRTPPSMECLQFVLDDLDGWAAWAGTNLPRIAEEMGLPPPSTTVAPTVETLIDLKIIEAGVAAFYSGDAERAVELFELQEPNDDQIRSEAVWQAAIGGRLDLNCTEFTPGRFSCHMRYHNAMTDAINLLDRGEPFRVVVENGVITVFEFPEHSGLMTGLAGFMLGVKGNQACEHEELLVLPHTAECANLTWTTSTNGPPGTRPTDDERQRRVSRWPARRHRTSRVAICVAVRSRTGQHQTTRLIEIRRQDSTKRHPLGLDGRYGRDC
jgi:hypothetical protein